MVNFKINVFAVLFLIGGLFSSCEKKSAKEEGVYYTCPMHPQIKKDVPGQCPICGMDLVKKELGK
jgi:Cu(I)/Ag(I) efflux system membrane fusion protein